MISDDSIILGCTLFYTLCTHKRPEVTAWVKLRLRLHLTLIKFVHVKQDCETKC